MIYSVHKLQRLLPDHNIKHCHNKFRLEKLPFIEKISSVSDHIFILDCTMIPATDRTKVKKFYKNYIRAELGERSSLRPNSNSGDPAIFRSPDPSGGACAAGSDRNPIGVVFYYKGLITILTVNDRFKGNTNGSNLIEETVMLTVKREDSEFEKCPACSENVDPSYFTPCHTCTKFICKQCLPEHVTSDTAVVCPMCAISKLNVPIEELL